MAFGALSVLVFLVPVAASEADSAVDKAWRDGFADGLERRCEEPFEFPEAFACARKIYEKSGYFDSRPPALEAAYLEGEKAGRARRGTRLVDVPLVRAKIAELYRAERNRRRLAGQTDSRETDRVEGFERAHFGRLCPGGREVREECYEEVAVITGILHDPDVRVFDPRSGRELCDQAFSAISLPVKRDAVRELARALQSHLDTDEAQWLLLGTGAEKLDWELQPVNGVLDGLDEISRRARVHGLKGPVLHAALKPLARQALDLPDHDYEAVMRILSLRELVETGSAAIHSRFALALDDVWSADYQTYFDVGAGLAAATGTAAVILTRGAVVGAFASGLRVGAGALTIAKVVARQVATSAAVTGVPAGATWHGLSDPAGWGPIAPESAFLGFNTHIRKYESPLSAMEGFQRRWTSEESFAGTVEAVAEACAGWEP